MYKYRAIASFHLWPEICAAAMNGTRRLIEKRGVDKEVVDFDHFWRNFHLFVDYKHAHGYEREELFAPVAARMEYDFEGWLASSELRSPQCFRFDQARPCEFRLSEEGIQELDSALAVWTYELKGLTKLVTRIRITSQIRELHYLSEEGANGSSRMEETCFA
jgi:hypothetical protein